MVKMEEVNTSDEEMESGQEELSDEDIEEEIEDELEDEEEKPKRRKKPGIIYLSSIPPGMNPQLVREFLGVHGEIGKSFLQPIESIYDIIIGQKFILIRDSASRTR